MTYRRPWKDRLARSCDDISIELLDQFRQETGKPARAYPEEFLAWVGLKATPTALKRVASPLRRASGGGVTE